MKSNQDGLVVPRRVIFIMILVSLFINVFFLLMGILIGKEDLKWSRQGQEEALPVQEVKAGGLDQTEVESDLSVFDDEDKGGQTEPVDVSYLDASLEGKTGTTGGNAAKEPIASPSPPVEEKKSAPATQPGSELSGGYWVQVLATKEKDKADDFQGKLAATGYRSVVFFEGQYHKVQVGPFSEKIAAEAVNREIEKAFNTKGWVRKR